MFIQCNNVVVILELEISNINEDRDDFKSIPEQKKIIGDDSKKEAKPEVKKERKPHVKDDRVARVQAQMDHLKVTQNFMG